MNLLEWFHSLTPDVIEKLLGEPETQVFDCKLPGSEKDFRRNLAIVISGFGNATGGVCLWGAVAKKKDDVDCICAVPGVSNPAELLSRLSELTPQAVSPPYPGVVHRIISKSDKAFVATYVPASEGSPLMARYGEDRFYQRIGTSFMRMESFQIADMYGRRAAPELRISGEAISGFEVRLKIENVGRGTAQAPYLQLKADPPFTRNQYGIDGNRTEHLPLLHTEPDGSWLHAAGLDFVIHPTMAVRVGGVWLGFQPSIHGTLPQICRIHYKAGALGIAPIEGVLDVPVG